MQINRRKALNGLVCGAAGSAFGAAKIPVYSNFFGAPVRPDRYTRNMHNLTASRVVEKPSFYGGHSLEMELHFSEKERFGMLLWDLAPVRFSRVRFHILNPNPAQNEIILRTTLADTKGRNWSLNTEAQPLLVDQWEKVDVGLAKGATVMQGKIKLEARDIDDAVFVRMTFRFSIRPNFPAFGAPHLLYLNGLECF